MGLQPSWRLATHSLRASSRLISRRFLSRVTGSPGSNSFSLRAEQDPELLEPQLLSQWRFWVVASGKLHSERKSIGLQPLIRAYGEGISDKEWPFLDQDVLVRTSSRKVCMTCHWFRHHAGLNFIPLLTCQLHQGLLAHGEHLTRRCHGWTEDMTRQRGWAPESGVSDGPRNRPPCAALPAV